MKVVHFTAKLNKNSNFDVFLLRLGILGDHLDFGAKPCQNFGNWIQKRVSSNDTPLVFEKWPVLGVTKLEWSYFVVDDMQKCCTEGPNDPQKSTNAFLEFSKSCKNNASRKAQKTHNTCEDTNFEHENNMGQPWFGATRLNFVKVALGFGKVVRDSWSTLTKRQFFRALVEKRLSDQAPTIFFISDLSKNSKSNQRSWRWLWPVQLLVHSFLLELENTG